MISFCCGFYPWYREHERTEEVFDVLIAGLNSMYGVEDCELSIVNAAVVDIWNYKPQQAEHRRKFNSYKFKERICKSFKGKVKYLLDEESIHWSHDARRPDSKGIPRYWVSKSIQTAIDISSNDYIVITGIDCYFTDYFLLDFFQKVAVGKAWVIMSISTGSVGDIEHYKTNKIKRQHYTAKGIIGITKKDYFKLGGLDCSYIKDRSDSNFYDRLIESDLKVSEDFVNNVYHVAHPGSHMTYNDSKRKRR